ncbi:hypothetical protein ACFL3Q_08840 [Planctomycetota bacterium]
MSDAKHPKAQFRNSNFKAAVWENKSEKDGGTLIQHSVTLQKSFKDPGTDEWKHFEMRLFPAEIPAMISVAQKAYDKCLLKEECEQETD